MNLIIENVTIDRVVDSNNINVEVTVFKEDTAERYTESGTLNIKGNTFWPDFDIDEDENYFYELQEAVENR